MRRPTPVSRVIQRLLLNYISYFCLALPKPLADCDLNYTPNKAVKVDIQVALSDNLGFGGHNGVVVFKKIQ